jgi:hypothetical protein
MLAQVLDTFIQDHNSDYKAKRSGDMLMKLLQIILVKPGTFRTYMESKNKL